MTIKTTTTFAALLTGASLLGACTTLQASEPLALAGAPCNQPPILRCPDTDCGALVSEQGPVKDEASGRNYFVDYPCDLKQGEKVTMVLSLHGAGSYGNWQRHYFPIADYVDAYRLVVITPNAPPRRWAADADDAYLQRLVTTTIDQIGANNVKSFWLAGHSQGGMTSRRIACSEFFADKVDGFLSLSGGRVGGQAVLSANFRPAPQRGQAAPPAPAAGTTPPAAPTGGMSAGAADPTCDYSHIYATGEHEIVALPDTSSWAERYGCDVRSKPEDIVDTKAGYIYDSSRQDPPTLGWGRPAKPGTSEVFEYRNCRDGRVVADVVRLDKGHTEGLEPKITERLVKLITKAKGGKISSKAS